MDYSNNLCCKQGVWLMTDELKCNQPLWGKISDESKMTFVMYPTFNKERWICEVLK